MLESEAVGLLLGPLTHKTREMASQFQPRVFHSQVLTQLC